MCIHIYKARADKEQLVAIAVFSRRIGIVCNTWARCIPRRDDGGTRSRRGRIFSVFFFNTA